MIDGSCQNLMFPHPWGFVGDMYKVSCEVIALQHKKKVKNGFPFLFLVWFFALVMGFFHAVGL